MTPTPEAILAMRERCAKATPSPWECDKDEPTMIDAVADAGFASYGVAIVSSPHRIAKEDAAFIAAARTDLPAALDLIADLLDVIDRICAEYKFPSYYVTPAWRSVATSLRKGST